MKHIQTWFLKKQPWVRVELVILAVFFVAFSFGQLGRISITPSITLYPHDVVVAVWLLLHMRPLARLITVAFHWLPKHPLVVVTAVWVLVGLVWGNLEHFQLRPMLLLLRVIVYVLFAASVGSLFTAERILLRSVLVIVGNLMLWFGLLQYVLLPDTRFLSILGWDDHYFRLIGPLFDPNFMGMFIVLLIIFSASIHRVLPRKLQFVLQSYYAALLALTYSRASYATAGMTAFLLASTPYPYKKWSMRLRLALGIVVLSIFAVTLYIAPKPGGEGVKLLRTSSIEARQSTAAQSFNNLNTVDLIIGKGLFSYPLPATATLADEQISQHAQVPDNIFVLLLSGTGIFGTILIITSLIYWIGQLAAKETAMAIAVAVTLLHAQFNNTLFEPFIGIYLLLAVLSPLDQGTAMTSPHKKFREKLKKSKHQDTR